MNAIRDKNLSICQRVRLLQLLESAAIPGIQHIYSAITSSIYCSVDVCQNERVGGEFAVEGGLLDAGPCKANQFLLHSRWLPGCLAWARSVSGLLRRTIDKVTYSTGQDQYVEIFNLIIFNRLNRFILSRIYLANSSITEEEAENMISNKTTSMFVGNVCPQKETYFWK